MTDQVLRTWDRINIIVSGKPPLWQWLAMEQAESHCKAGIGIWDWASHKDTPDVVMACAGDVPTLETLAAVDILRRHMPLLKIRVVNVVDLMTLQPMSVLPHGLSDQDFDALFTTDTPIIFAYYRYPWTIHRLTYRRYRRTNPTNQSWQSACAPL